MYVIDFIKFDKQFFEEAYKNISASLNDLSEVDLAKSTLQKLKDLIKHHEMNEVLVPVFNMTNDLSFVNDTIRAAKTQASRNNKPVRFFSFEYKTDKNIDDVLDFVVSGKKCLFFPLLMILQIELDKQFLLNLELTQGDDVKLLFDPPRLIDTVNSHNSLMRNELLSLWASFSEIG